MPNSADAFQAYINEVEGRLTTYRSDKGRAYWYWLTAQIVLVLTGLSSTLVAALTSNKEDYPKIRGFLIGLPLLGSLATTMLTRFKLYELWQIRDTSVSELQAILDVSKQEFSAASAETEVNDVYKRLVEKVTNLELSMPRRWFALPLGVQETRPKATKKDSPTIPGKNTSGTTQ